jgi:crotonobetainyl-CoA:carnitine CoA-transferase CaiB-like acyl-CoA transferase
VGCVEADLRGQPVVTVYDEVLRDTGLTTTIDHPIYGELVRSAPPIAFSETPSRVAPPCMRGQHNVSILTGLGYDSTDIAMLEDTGVVLPPTAPVLQSLAAP